MNAQKYNPDVLTCLANLSNDEVFTPPDVANKMLDTLPNELWSNPKAKFLDPFCKSGVFLREIAKRLLKGLESQLPDLQERIDHIMHHQLYGIGITELTAYLSRRSLYCSTRAAGKHSVTEFPDESGNIYFEEIAHTWDKAGKCIYCGVSSENFGEEKREGLSQHAYAFIHNKNPYENMNFDVIIGNPPYQLDDGGAGASAKPIYHLFVEQAKKLNPQFLIMITPSRWFTGGKGLDGFRDSMLNDRRIKEIHDFPNSKDCFDNVEIKGGVNYFLWEKRHDGGCEVFTYDDGHCVSNKKRSLKEKEIDVFIRYNQAINILYKVKNFNEPSFANLISSRKPFGFATNFKGKNKPFKNSVKIYRNGGIGYVDISEIERGREWILKHKVIVPYAVGSGDGKTDKVNPIYAGINTACTETYLVIGPFKSEEICNNVMSYINTKFLHFMLTLKKNTQHTTKGVYQLVPMQDFSRSWTDEQLYAKYGLSKDEINFIESMIRPME